MSLSPIPNHSGQHQIWKDNNRFIVIVAGRRWGKTLLAGEMLINAMGKPKSNNLYIAPTRHQAKELIWDYLKNRIREFKWRVKVNESDLTIKRNNGATISIKSAEKEDRVRGLGYDLAVLDEYADFKTATLWTQALRPALSDRLGRAVFFLTPKGFNHAYDLYQQAKTSKDWSIYTFKTIDSPFFQTEEGRKEIQEAKLSLTEKDFRQEYEASFENYSGRIYYAFDRGDLNIDYKYNPDLPIIIGQDFNRSPMASAVFQRVRGELIQFDEIFLRVADTMQTCKEIEHRYPQTKIIIRPDATGSRKTSNSSRSDFDIIRSFNFEIESAKLNPRRIDRWATVNRCFEKKLVKFVVDKCPISVKDREILCYKEGTCEPMLNDPMVGHISDAGDYAIYREYEILRAPSQPITFIS